MYRDNSLMPKEAVRLAALGALKLAGPTRYGDLATSVRHFTDRIVGPSLDLMGTSLEMLRYEGLVKATQGTGMEDNAVLEITAAGRGEFQSLMRACVRAPASDPLNKLVIALKLRFLHLLELEIQREQIEALISLCETELARLNDLDRRMGNEPGHFADWLHHDIAELRWRSEWFRELYGKICREPLEE